MHLPISSTKKKEVIDITNKVQEILQLHSIQQGVCVLFVKNTTACLTTANLDPGTDLDMLDAFAKLIPTLPYRHPHNPKHAPDHILSSLIGPSVTIPIIDGELALGTWQRIVLIDLDGPRERDILIQVLQSSN
ncbi:MAG: secondary thiamine-phosphate synthase enzyme YjbQ [Patescibacteria group bacterium]